VTKKCVKYAIIESFARELYVKYAIIESSP